MKCEYQEQKADENGTMRWQAPVCDQPGDRRALDAAGPDSNPQWVGYFCGEHAAKVVERAQPKAVVCCPSCGCRIGVNS